MESWELFEAHKTPFMIKNKSTIEYVAPTGLDMCGICGALSGLMAVLMKDVSKKNDILASADWTDLENEVREAVTVLVDATHSICTNHNIDFRDMFKNYYVFQEETLQWVVDPVLEDPS